MTTTHVLENKFYSLEFDRRNGSLVQLRDKLGGFDLIHDARLAESFRLLVPLPEMRANYILGTQQKLGSCEIGSLTRPVHDNGPASPTNDAGEAHDQENRGDCLKLHWPGPLVNERGATFDLEVTLWIELAGEEIQFRCEVQNRTAQQLTEVWFAMIGGMRGLGEGNERSDTEVFLPRDNKAWKHPIFRDFGNTRGQMLGMLGGEHGLCYPGFMCMPWLSLFQPKRKRALYAAALEKSPRIKSIRFALEPGLAEQRLGGNWPTPEEVGNLPFGLTMNWVHYPFTKPGEKFSSAPVVMRCHDGGWRESAALYREWFHATFPVIKPGSTWIRRETTFLHTMFMLPEDNINLRFVDIPKWAKDAKDRGVTHVMIAGWQIGGHDRGYPQYTPDPRLGTWDELQAGIRAAHDLGVRVSFFANCQPVDLTTDWYKKELYKYRIVDPYGEPYFVTNYWGMGTLSARSRFQTATPHTELNPLHPEYRAHLIAMFRKLIEIGADGLHLDKFFQTPFDFNPRLTQSSPDRAHHEGLLVFLEELFAACRAINPEFCISYEGGWDRFYQYADLMWWGQGDDTALKAVFPQTAYIYGVEQPYDFNKVNRAMLQGESLLIGPANYNRGLDYPPMQKLIEYISEITRISKELFDVISLGEMDDASHGVFRRAEPTVKFEAAKEIKWTVFCNPKTGQRAVVLANLGGEAVEVNNLTLAAAQAGNSSCRIFEAFQPARETKFPASVRIPAERVLVVVQP